MVKKNLTIIISSVVIWLPVLNLIFRSTALPRIVFHITYLSLLIFPIIASINIIAVLRIWYMTRTFNILNILVFISNITFLTVGMKYLKSVAWFI